MIIVPFREPNEMLHYAYFFDVTHSFGMSYPIYAHFAHNMLLGNNSEKYFLYKAWYGYLFFSDASSMAVLEFRKWMNSNTSIELKQFLKKAKLP